MPDFFSTLRNLIDQGCHHGKRTGRFLILGSASIKRLRQSSETLAGRIEYLELGPCSILEVGSSQKKRDQLGLRGGFPTASLQRVILTVFG
jgi:predicted AAA+ superfamily ATPase